MINKREPEEALNVCRLALRPHLGEVKEEWFHERFSDMLDPEHHKLPTPAGQALINLAYALTRIPADLIEPVHAFPVVFGDEEGDLNCRWFVGTRAQGCVEPLVCNLPSSNTAWLVFDGVDYKFYSDDIDMTPVIEALRELHRRKYGQPA